ncbi:MlaE family ABC transporter permease [Mucilaginibacter lappiensis]|uniref:Phospholipid/cholesterol/gamma-HCH transport system permease protein n=1 Tax=Mucilaginibacter lappiensis TaxID=354630 RepID=A0A1N7FD19_9SPHI|nr:ABC transporter permease [Mucilaginibacter lappiensis]MBB6112252.1 phospholipid/cholesterol/gamma-HCH transport system permease protein [Mucilaginibacter lappiensis]MBB6129072.1 phospholipid/cholesterol/gamma-HCH transport system permease protein [Mucilaginibacter lappiensis]SIR98202.1 phospholipid/cholesterol/gamma-HCH transport system permease protein [Mucilaginibacter lappiensis]
MFQSLGKYILLLRLSFRKPEKFSVYWSEVMREMVSVGVGSLGIIAIISVFIGAVATIQTAFQLVSDFIPKTIVGGITRDSTILEFSPTISALVLAGRVGSSMASQIGTMRVTEQIDALEIMGVNAPGYLISPKIIAGVTMIPLLVIVSVILGLVGGYIACAASNDVSTADYVTGLTDGFNPVIVTVCAVKAIFFGFIITSICSYQGFYTDGGSLEVGQSATRGVVWSCIMILFVDLIISRLLL